MGTERLLLFSSWKRTRKGQSIQGTEGEIICGLEVKINIGY